MISAVQNVAQQAVDVAAPVVLSAGLIAAGSAGGAVIGSEIAGDALPGTFGEWSRPVGQVLGKAGGAIGGTRLPLRSLVIYTTSS